MAEIVENPQKSVEIRKNSWNFNVFWANLKWRFNILRLLVWYQRSHLRNVDFTIYEAQQAFDRHVLAWTLGLAYWTFTTSLTGWILWFLAYFFLNPPFPWFYFFPLGVLYWTLKKVRIELIGGKNAV